MKKTVITLMLAGASTISWSQNALISKLDSIMDAYARLNWNAVVFVGKPGKVIYQRAIGYADIEKKIPLQPSALVPTASAGKMFTATRIMQLVQEKKLSLNSPVKDLLLEWNIPNLDKITIHHLLTHTSGMGSPWDHPAYDFTKHYSKAERKKIIEEVPLAFHTPGERKFYSNTGYILLQHIIEKIDGMDFVESIKRNIFKPAGIPLRINDPNAAKLLALPYYQVASNQFIKDEVTVKSNYAGSGEGGWVLNGMDLFNFLSAYASGKYLNEETQKIQLTANGKYPSLESNYRYGMSPLPWNVKNKRLVIGHNGGGKGTSAEAYYDVESGYIVSMVSNQFAAGYVITGNLFKSLFKEPVTMPVHSSEVKVVDQIKLKGRDFLLHNTDSFFSSIKVTPTPFLFETVYNNLKLLDDYASAEVFMTIGRKLFPQSADMLLYSGEVAFKLKGRNEAKQFYLDALRLAEANQNTLLTHYIQSKLKQVE